jgi:hypothetical protein
LLLLVDGLPASHSSRFYCAVFQKKKQILQYSIAKNSINIIPTCENIPETEPIFLQIQWEKVQHMHQSAPGVPIRRANKTRKIENDKRRTTQYESDQVSGCTHYQKMIVDKRYSSSKKEIALDYRLKQEISGKYLYTWRKGSLDRKHEIVNHAQAHI